MIFFAELISKIGIGPVLAKLIAWIITITLIVISIWWAYDTIYAAPRRQVVALQGEVQTTRTELTTTKGDLVRWTNTAKTCSLTVTKMAASCAIEVAKANKKAVAVTVIERKRLQPLLDDSAKGPDAMNKFFTELYQ